VALFLAVVVFVLTPTARPGGAPSQSLITMVACAMTAVLLPLSVVIPNLVVDSLRKKLAVGKYAPAKGSLPTGDDEALALIYQTRVTIAAAMTEGPAFLAVIAYMLERNPLALGLAIALLGCLVMRTPTLPKVVAWIDEQSQKLQADRVEARLD
jgi:hypothetical protein